MELQRNTPISNSTNLRTHSGLSKNALCVLVGACAPNDYKPPVKSIVLRRRGGATMTASIQYRTKIGFGPKKSLS